MEGAQHEQAQHEDAPATATSRKSMCTLWARVQKHVTASHAKLNVYKMKQNIQNSSTGRATCPGAPRPQAAACPIPHGGYYTHSRALLPVPASITVPAQARSSPNSSRSPSPCLAPGGSAGLLGLSAKPANQIQTQPPSQGRSRAVTVTVTVTVTVSGTVTQHSGQPSSEHTGPGQQHRSGCHRLPTSCSSPPTPGRSPRC
jgi:hypothetical protein